VGRALDRGPHPEPAQVDPPASAPVMSAQMGSFLLAIPPTFRSNLARGKLDTHNPLLRNQPSDALPCGVCESAESTARRARTTQKIIRE
jgi:hypothetical protein